MILFRELVLKNFRSFVGEHVFPLDRPAGLYHVTGNNLVEPALGANGVGKSTVFDAFFWCLTGRTIRDRMPGAAVEPWMNGHDPKMGVALVFVRNGIEYVLARGRHPNALELSGGPEGMQTRTVAQEEIYALLGMNDEALRRSILIGQFGTLFLDLKPDEQSRMFTDILDLDQWIRASERARKAGTDTETKVRAKSMDLAAAEGSLAVSTTNLERERASENEFADQIKCAIEKADVEIADIDTQLKALEEPTKPEVDTVAITQLGNALETLRQQVRTLDNDIVQRRTAVNRRKDAVDQLINQVGRYAEAITGAKTCPECGQKVSTAHLEGKRDSYQAMLDQARIDADKATSELTTKVNARRALDAEITETNAKLTTARQDLDAYIVSHNQYDLAYNRLHLRSQTCRNQRIEIEGRVNPHSKTIETLLADMVRFREKISSLEVEIIAQQKIIDGYKYWANAFKEIRLQQIEEALLELEVTTNRHAECLGLHDWNIHFTTVTTTQSGKAVSSFSAEITPPGVSKPIPWENTSGGEAQRWQLAVVLGLSEVLLARAGLSSNVLVIDEPSQHLSQTGIDDLLIHLRNRAKELNQVIYFVDHRALDRGEFEGVIMVERLEEGSRIVV